MLPTPVSWFGGKTHLRDFILPHIEDTSTVYVEPFCGSANIFFAKTPHPVEVLNDLNGDIVNFFRVLQNRRLFRTIAHRIRWTPYAVEEFIAAITLLASPPPKETSLDRAWAFFVRGGMGFSGMGDSRGNWGRSFKASGDINMVCARWQSRISYLEAWRDRLRGAQIDCLPALDVLAYWDSKDTVFYLDPPYVEETRASLNIYSHEMTNSDHGRLVRAILDAKGRIVLSGYASSQYASLESNGWIRLDKTIASPMAWDRGEDGAEGTRGERTEVLWVNRLGAQPNIFYDGTTEEPTTDVLSVHVDRLRKRGQAPLLFEEE